MWWRMEEEIENVKVLDLFEYFNPLKTNNLNCEENVNDKLKSSCLLSRKNNNSNQLRDKKLEKSFELQNILFQLQDQDELLHKKIKKVKKELRELQLDIQRENDLALSDLSLSYKASPNNLSLESPKNSQDSVLSTSIVSSIHNSFNSEIVGGERNVSPFTEIFSTVNSSDGLNSKNISSETTNGFSLKWLKKKETKENDTIMPSTNIGVLLLFYVYFVF
jgi:hypothetical protein